MANETGFRIEHDTMGEVKVPADKYWAAQTQRSFENFKIGVEKIPAEVIDAFAVLKKAAALANTELGMIEDVYKRQIYNTAAVMSRLTQRK